MALGLIGIFVAMILFLYMVYKGCSQFWSVVVCSILVVLTNLSPEGSVFVQIADSISGPFLDGIVTMIKALFPVIFLGAILGKIYNDTGAAESIARTLTNTFVVKRVGKQKVAAAIGVLWIVAAACTMGGIDGYVLTFTLFPISLVIFEMCNIPRRFIPAVFCLNCAFMTAPGAPQIYNIMTEAAFKSQIPKFAEQGANGIVGQLSSVSSTSALIPGIVATLIATGAGVITLIYMINKAMANGEVFEYGPLPKMAIPERKLPNFIVALLPLACVFVMYTILRLPVFIALTGGVILAFATMAGNLQKVDQDGQPIPVLKRIISTLNIGANTYPNALLTVSTPAGLAGVVMATAAFGMIVGILSGIQVSPIILAVITICIIVALTSAPPTSLMIGVPMILGIVAGPAIGAAADVAAATLPVNVHALFRVSALAAGTFETLPINGLIILGLGLARTTHKQSYFPMFMMTVLYTFIATIVCAAICLAFPGLV